VVGEAPAALQGQPREVCQRRDVHHSCIPFSLFCEQKAGKILHQSCWSGGGSA
jgi:hypothetical protein